MTAAAFWDAVAWLRERCRRYGVAACVVALLLLVGHFRHFTIQYCAICASERRSDESGFGLDPGRGLTLRASDEVRESAAYRDLCDADHVHVWRTDHILETQGPGTCLFCGGWRPGAFAGLYEREPDLRAIVCEEIESATLDRATALRLVAVPRHGWESGRAVPGTLPDDALLATAERLLRSHFAPLETQAPGYVAAYLSWMGKGAR